MTDLKQARTRLGLSQPQLAVMAGVSDTTILNAENGKHKPHKRTYDRIVRALEIAKKQAQARPAPAAMPTHGDAIRRMGDEEMVLAGVICCCKNMDGPKHPCDGDCYRCKLDWLAKEDA